jgi:radical SAM protein with 4Fe4S-binding SPASM domain
MPVIRDRRFLRVKLDMVTRCQLRCIMCHFAHPDFQENAVVLGGPLLERVAAELFPRAHEVALSSSAEPLMAPDLPRALELCREHGVPAFHFSTNALSMTEKIMHKIIEVQMPHLTISCDGATKETFEKIRKPARWEPFVRKLELIERVRREVGSSAPSLTLTCVLMKSNVREAPDVVRFAHAHGFAQVHFNYMAVMGGLGVEHETVMDIPRLTNRMVAEAKQVGDRLGVAVWCPMPLPEQFEGAADATDAARSDAGGGSAIGGPAGELPATSFTVAEFLNHKNREFLLKAKQKQHHNRPCYFPWYYIHVNPDGTVFPCGCWFEFTTFGDFKTQTFEEIWTGPKYRELRRQLYHMQLRDVCANCSVANMGRPDVRASFSHRAKVRRSGVGATTD